MKIYVVIKNIDDYPECGGGKYPDAVFLSYANAEKYATRKKTETKNCDKHGRKRIMWRVEAWETADEKENENVER